MTLRDRAARAAEQAYSEFIAGSAEAFELTLAALALQEGGMLFVSHGALQAAQGLSVASEQAEGGVILRLESGDAPAAAAAPVVQPVEEDEPVEFIDEDELEDTTEARQARYIERMAGKPRHAGGGGVATLRPWDSPDDLQHQEVAKGRPRTIRKGDPDYDEHDHRAQPLSSGDGSVTVGMG